MASKYAGLPDIVSVAACGAVLNLAAAAAIL